jgi:hypothetical protein
MFLECWKRQDDMSRVNFTEASEGDVNRDDVPAEGLSLANCANSSGVRFTLFKNPTNILSYGSLVAGLLIAAENNSKLSP